MSWYCKMDGDVRRCMDWDLYSKKGWQQDKSFLVWEYQGVFKKEELKEKQDEKDL